MNQLVKVYEELLPDALENINENEYKTWLNEMLEEESIPYENKIILKDTFEGEVLSTNNKNLYVEVYVSKEFESRALELIENYSKANIVIDEFETPELEQIQEENYEVELCNYNWKIDSKFDESRDLSEHISEYNNSKEVSTEKNKRYKKVIIVSVIFVFLFLLLFAAFAEQRGTEFYILVGSVILSMIIFAIVLMSSFIQEGSNNKKLKKIFQNICISRANQVLKDYNYSPDGISKKYFESTKIFEIFKEDGYDYPYHYSSKNTLKYVIDGKEILISEVQMKEKISEREAMYNDPTIIDGVFVRKYINKPISNSIVIWEQYVEDEDALKKDNLETKFRKKFKVEPETKLSLKFMEGLLAICDEYKTNVSVAINDEVLNLIIQDYYVVKINDINKSELADESMRRNIEKIEKITSLVEKLIEENL